MTHHIIIGGGPVATNAIQTIRQYDDSSAITLISDELAHSRRAGNLVVRRTGFQGETVIVR